ncbi:MAG: hypothetical protein RIR12_45 [Bacteroidota bacterium]|jgi:hypothetical protein
MRPKFLYLALKVLIAGVWLVNGLWCKVLNYVPRHQAIVSAIVGSHYAHWVTNIIGWAEMLMAIWIISEYKSKLNTATQIAAIAMMNIIECIVTPHLLLWGRWNAFFALLFILVIYFQEYWFKKTYLID